MMSSKSPRLSLPGELPDLDHQTISLRAQLRLSYETYPWLRYLTWGGLVLLAAALVILPGGFPPQVAVLFWQTLLVIGRLMQLHGAAALLSLLALGIQTLTLLILWFLLGVVSYRLARYSWQKRNGRRILRGGWLSSTTLSNGLIPINLARTTPLDPDNAPELPKGPAVSPLRATSAAKAAVAPLVRSLADTKTHVLAPSSGHPDNSSAQSQAQRRQSLADTRTHVLAPSSGPGNGSAPSQSQHRQSLQNLLDVPSQSQARQFAQPSLSLSPVPAKSRSMLSGEFPLSWGLMPGLSTPGVAWDPGLKRKGRPNEDSVLTIRGTCNPGGAGMERLLPFELHIVADGMGGHAQGRLASHLAIRSMLETVVPGLVAANSIEGEQIVDILIDGVHWANQVIYQYGQEHNADMGTTVTAVLLLDETAYIINVGDSRTYIYRPNVGLTQITRDHSIVARLVETGAITPEEIYTHPERNKVYRGLGDKTDVTVDWFVLSVQSGDLLLLCSDGLWEMVRDPRIADILQTYANSPALASNALLRAALQAGGSDNVSLLVTRVN